MNGNVWAVDKMVAAKGKVSFSVPTCIPSGGILSLFITLIFAYLPRLSSPSGANCSPWGTVISWYAKIEACVK